MQPLGHPRGPPAYASVLNTSISTSARLDSSLCFSFAVAEPLLGLSNCTSLHLSSNHPPLCWSSECSAPLYHTPGITVLVNLWSIHSADVTQKSELFFILSSLSLTTVFALSLIWPCCWILAFQQTCNILSSLSVVCWEFRRMQKNSDRH